MTITSLIIKIFTSFKKENDRQKSGFNVGSIQSRTFERSVVKTAERSNLENQGSGQHYCRQ